MSLAEQVEVLEAKIAASDTESLRADLAELRPAEDAEAEQDAREAEAVIAATPAAVEAVEVALDELILAMGALLDARTKYANARGAGRALRARARKAEVPVPRLDDYASRVLTDYPTRKIDDAWRVAIVSEIR